MRNMVPDNPQFHHYELLEVLAGDFQGMAHSVGVELFVGDFFADRPVSSGLGQLSCPGKSNQSSVRIKASTTPGAATCSCAPHLATKEMKGQYDGLCMAFRGAASLPAITRKISEDDFSPTPIGAARLSLSPIRRPRIHHFLREPRPDEGNSLFPTVHGRHICELEFRGIVSDIAVQ